MWAALRTTLSFISSPSYSQRPWKLGFSGFKQSFSSAQVNRPDSTDGLLDLQEIEKVLTDVKADDVKVLPVLKHCDWADFIVIATGRSTWHVKNIAQALIYKSKQKQRGVHRMVLPSVEGQEGGKWIVVDSGACGDGMVSRFRSGRPPKGMAIEVTGKVIVHALDEKARAYYDLEGLWGSVTSENEHNEDLVKAFHKVRPINNSKKSKRTSGRN